MAQENGFIEGPFLTFDAKDLVGRTLQIISMSEANLELIVAVDVDTEDVFVLEEIIHTEEKGASH